MTPRRGSKSLKSPTGSGSESRSTSKSGSFHDIAERAEARVGMIQVSGRYHKEPKKLETDYLVCDKVLGNGLNGAVNLATSQSYPNHKYAVKEFKLKNVPDVKMDQLVSEVEVFLCMDHPHIARLLDVYESKDRLDLVMECIEGGELFDRVSQKKRFTESDAADVTWQMLLALNYIHSHGILHGDIKLENFMFDSPDSNHLKLIDFGFSKMCDEARNDKAFGTLSYIAPEVIDHKCTSQSDMWSLGIVVFIILSGYMPFSGPRQDMIRNISEGRYTMKPEKWANISVDACSFIKSLLQVDPRQRSSAQDALEHPFIVKRPVVVKPEVDSSIVEALLSFGRLSAFRRCCMTMMAWSLTSEERSTVEEYFLTMDEKHQGSITYEGLKKVMVGKFRLPVHDLKRTFEALDTHHDKEIHFSDFLAAMVSTRIAVHDELLHDAFRKFDTHDHGYIMVDDLREILGDNFEGKTVDKLLTEVDLLTEGKVSYNEFAAYIKQSGACTGVARGGLRPSTNGKACRAPPRRGSPDHGDPACCVMQ